MMELSPNTPIQALVSDAHASFADSLQLPPAMLSGSTRFAVHDEIVIWERMVRKQQCKQWRSMFGPRADKRTRRKCLRKKLAKRGNMRRSRGLAQSLHATWLAVAWPDKRVE